MYIYYVTISNCAHVRVVCVCVPLPLSSSQCMVHPTTFTPPTITKPSKPFKVPT